MWDEVIIPKLHENKYFTATSDLWTSSAKHPYLTYTTHFINDAWSLQSFLLDAVPLFEDDKILPKLFRIFWLTGV